MQLPVKIFQSDSHWMVTCWIIWTSEAFCGPWLLCNLLFLGLFFCWLRQFWTWLSVCLLPGLLPLKKLSRIPLLKFHDGIAWEAESEACLSCSRISQRVLHALYFFQVAVAVQFVVAWFLSLLGLTVLKLIACLFVANAFAAEETFSDSPAEISWWNCLRSRVRGMLVLFSDFTTGVAHTLFLLSCSAICCCLVFVSLGFASFETDCMSIYCQCICRWRNFLGFPCWNFMMELLEKQSQRHACPVPGFDNGCCTHFISFKLQCSLLLLGFCFSWVCQFWNWLHVYLLPMHLPLKKLSRIPLLKFHDGIAWEAESEACLSCSRFWQRVLHALYFFQVAVQFVVAWFLFLLGLPVLKLIACLFIANAFAAEETFSDSPAEISWWNCLRSRVRGMFVLFSDFTTGVAHILFLLGSAICCCLVAFATEETFSDSPAEVSWWNCLRSRVRGMLVLFQDLTICDTVCVLHSVMVLCNLLLKGVKGWLVVPLLKLFVLGRGHLSASISHGAWWDCFLFNGFVTIFPCIT